MGRDQRMKAKQKISVWQMALMLTVSRMFFIFTDTPAYGQATEPTARIIGSLLSIPLTFMILIPVFILFHRQSQQGNFLEMAFGQSRPFGTIVAWCLLIGMLIGAVGTLVHFGFFMQNTTFPSIKTPMVLILLFAGALYASTLGLEGFSRTASIIFWLLPVSLLLLLAFSYDVINFNHIRPIFNHPVRSVIQAAWTDATRTSELAVLLILFPHVKGRYHKVVTKFVLFSGIGLVFVTTLCTVILGEYMYHEAFPLFTVSSIVDLGSIRRLETIYMMLWTMVAFLRLTLYLFAGKVVLYRLLPLKIKWLSYWILGAITLLLSIILGNTLESTRMVYMVVQNGWITLLLILFFPFLLAAFSGNRRRLEDM